jgi:alpha-mannosidase
LTLQVNLGVYVADEKYELSVLVDRAVGASSIQDGQLEIMLHRYQLKWRVLSITNPLPD